jgi:hypothetical protein
VYLQGLVKWEIGIILTENYHGFMKKLRWSLLPLHRAEGHIDLLVDHKARALPLRSCAPDRR